ncbi:Gfo/Idh/MocA family oxidoreductase [Bacillus sp. FJAT-49736]|uniref:Gfo/Idh/MocA family protein n=1 Tax=Bacillus sp. FJAT-49736 TaxID=2833582 RepID=UPI001BC8DE7D|nr:Gfo/Idh/MocA family oxidoreductase [Bacillus sp. FJAT-49736]MBS4174985.1 Gfo/Idh/MocA family oxidoreductase [Bacillus sp. FJAT-49736]
MDQNHLKVGIIGLGVVGERLLWQFVKHPKTVVASICDTNEARLHELQEKLENVKTYTNYNKIILDPSIDLIYIAVPPKLHHQIALEAAQAGKHILCEKPLANSLKEAEEMANIAETAKIVNAINFPLAYSSAVHTLKSKWKDGEIGTLKRVELKMHFSEWPRKWQQNPWIAGREQGGFIREITPHYIQVMQNFFGKITYETSLIDYPSSPELCETGVIAKLTLQDGTPVVMDGLSGIGRQEEISFKLYGDKGTLALKNWAKLEGETTEQSSFSIEAIENEEHQDLISEIVKAVEGRPARMVSFKDGYNVQRVLEQVLQH